MTAIKQFLKPNGWKVILSLLIAYIVALNLPLVEIIVSGPYFLPSLPSPYYAPNVFAQYFYGFLNIGFAILESISVLSILYFFSCLVYFIATKIFKRKSSRYHTTPHRILQRYTTVARFAQQGVGLFAPRGLQEFNPGLHNTKID